MAALSRRVAPRRDQDDPGRRLPKHQTFLEERQEVGDVVRRDRAPGRRGLVEERGAAQSAQRRIVGDGDDVVPAFAQLPRETRVEMLIEEEPRVASSEPSASPGAASEPGDRGAWRVRPPLRSPRSQPRSPRRARPRTRGLVRPPEHRQTDGERPRRAIGSPARSARSARRSDVADQPAPRLCHPRDRRRRSPGVGASGCPRRGSSRRASSAERDTGAPPPPMRAAFAVRRAWRRPCVRSPCYSVLRTGG